MEASQTETRMVEALHAKIVARFGEEPPCGVQGVAQLLQACDFSEEQAWSHLTDPGFRWQVYADRGDVKTPPSADGESSYAEDSVSPVYDRPAHRRPEDQKLRGGSDGDIGDQQRFFY